MNQDPFIQSQLDLFDKIFQQDTSGEKVPGYLLAPSGPGFVKIALPGDVKSFLSASLNAAIARGRNEKREEIRGINRDLQFILMGHHPLAKEHNAALNRLSRLLSTLEKPNEDDYERVPGCTCENNNKLTQALCAVHGKSNQCAI